MHIFAISSFDQSRRNVFSRDFLLSHGGNGFQVTLPVLQKKVRTRGNWDSVIRKTFFIGKKTKERNVF